ncbi:uncharacterized protein J3D65DRAFT_308018 [Phyllosticta citribraziliensis]|uniref:Uncharacterized protein n=1 Tax=Phyllosticta citribraziliensis TaxID=989973 RepID=A0ABR1LXZ0_9PEZI
MAVPHVAPSASSSSESEDNNDIQESIRHAREFQRNAKGSLKWSTALLGILVAAMVSLVVGYFAADARGGGFGHGDPAANATTWSADNVSEDFKRLLASRNSQPAIAETVRLSAALKSMAEQDWHNLTRAPLVQDVVQAALDSVFSTNWNFSATQDALRDLKTAV